MTPGRRGLVLLAILATAAMTGYAADTVRAERKWKTWNYAHVAWQGKASKAEVRQ